MMVRHKRKPDNGSVKEITWTNMNAFVTVRHLLHPCPLAPVKLMFLYSTVSTLNPMVGMVVTTSPSLSLYRMVVLPAASRPTFQSFTRVGHATVHGQGRVHGRLRRGDRGPYRPRRKQVSIEKSSRGPQGWCSIFLIPEGPVSCCTFVRIPKNDMGTCSSITCFTTICRFFSDGKAFSSHFLL